MSDHDDAPAAEAKPKRATRLPGQAPAPAAEAKPAADEGLPNSVDIDPAKLDGPVLTRQGWVVSTKARA